MRAYRAYTYRSSRITTEQPKRARPDSEDNHANTDTKIGATDPVTNTNQHHAGALDIEHIVQTVAANTTNLRHTTEQPPDSHYNDTDVTMTIDHAHGTTPGAELDNKTTSNIQEPNHTPDTNLQRGSMQAPG